MKDFLKLIGIIALITTIGFSMVACGEEEEEVVVIEGKLTIVGFDFDEEEFLVEADVFIEGNSTERSVLYFAADSYDATTREIGRGEIKNRRVTLNVWENKGGEAVIYTVKKDEEKELEFIVYIFDPDNDPEDPPVKEGIVTVKFNKGGIAIGEIDDVVNFPRPPAPPPVP